MNISLYIPLNFWTYRLNFKINFKKYMYTVKKCWKGIYTFGVLSLHSFNKKKSIDLFKQRIEPINYNLIEKIKDTSPIFLTT